MSKTLEDIKTLYCSTEEIKKYRSLYFSLDETIILWVKPPANKSKLLTQLRKIGDYTGQYVTSVRYKDLLEWNYDYTEVYFGRKTWSLEIEKVYSTYHKNDNCSYCSEYHDNLKKNLIYGIKIYRPGAIPIRYKDRLKHWKKF